jgi:hypothetical protein
MVKNGIYSSFWVLGIKLYPENSARVKSLLYPSASIR